MILTFLQRLRRLSIIPNLNELNANLRKREMLGV